MPRTRETPRRPHAAAANRERETGNELAVLDACRTLGLAAHPSERGKQESGGLRVDQAPRLTTLEQDKQRLTRMVADHALDRSIVKAGASGHV